MTSNPLPPYDYIDSLLSYNPATGEIWWKVARGKRVKAGDTAGCIDDSTGYRRIRIDGVRFLASRIAWLIHYGEDPGGMEVDHVNHDRLDNRIANPRLVPHKGNLQNQSIPGNNTSGVLGASWRKQANKWVSRIRVNGKKLHLGLFTALDAAAQARKAADREYGFHPNHGQPLVRLEEAA